MYENTKMRIVYGATIGGIITAIFVAAITIIAELAPPIKEWLKAVFSHHWVGKSILAAGLFVVLSFILALLPMQNNELNLRRGLTVLAWMTILAALVIAGFFVYEAV